MIGFFVRAVWSIIDSTQLKQRWVKFLPHVIDTLLLALGVAMVLQSGWALTSDWLMAKIVGLLAYIGFGILTLRAKAKAVKILSMVAALLCAGYIFSVAFSRTVLPF